MLVLVLLVALAAAAPGPATAPGPAAGAADTSLRVPGTTLRFGYGTGSAWVYQDLANAIPNDGNWHHYVVSFVRNNGGNSIATVFEQS